MIINNYMVKVYVSLKDKQDSKIKKQYSLQLITVIIIINVVEFFVLYLYVYIKAYFNH